MSAMDMVGTALIGAVLLGYLVAAVVLIAWFVIVERGRRRAEEALKRMKETR